MSKVFIKFFIIVQLYLVIPTSIIAQDICSENLKLAKQLFESGQIEQIPSLLDSCILYGFSKEQKNQAYHLLIQTYLFDYNQEKAKETMYRYLKDFPDYKLSASEAVEIRELYNGFEILPNWGFGLIVGTNVSLIQPIQYFSVANLNKIDSKYTPGSIGWNAGFQIEKYLGKHWCIATGAEYSGFYFKNVEKINSLSEQIDYFEKADYFSFPLNFCYFFGNRKFTPFLFTGGEYGNLSSIQSDTKKIINTLGQSFENNSRDLMDYRNKNLFWVSGGIGVNYKINRSSLKVWAGFNYNLNNLVNKNSRYNDLDYIINYQHIDDDIFIHQLFINISFTRLLYKVKYK